MDILQGLIAAALNLRSPSEGCFLQACGLKNFFQYGFWTMRNKKDPLKSIHHFLSDVQTSHVYMRVPLGSFFGAGKILFIKDPVSIQEVVNSDDFWRCNPLVVFRSWYTWWIGLDKFVDDHIAQSIFVLLDGEQHEKLRAIFLDFGRRIADLQSQDALAKNALAILQARVQGENSLFDILQEVATRILLEVLVGSSLPAGWTERRFLDLINRIMEAVFNIQCPSRMDQEDLRYIFDHFSTNSAENSLTQHLRRCGCSQEQTKHNLLALMLLGMQSLANGPYWQILRIYTERGLLKQVRENPQRVWAVIVEELHNHPPSAPILMPYRAKRNSTIRGQTILEGTVVVISPPWSHAMMGGAPQESTNPTGCPFQRSSSPIRSLQNAMGQCAHPRSYAFGASTRSSCPVKGFNMATMYSVITGFVDLYDMKASLL
ncbi:unnamed protein product [Durusdinium trenchii]|uniref:Cytochrome P450 n=1 Tax=Durusdinium trenchii TaxID=1381693 RepID=A0ABP0JHV4_9DINO